MEVARRPLAEVPSAGLLAEEPAAAQPRRPLPSSSCLHGRETEDTQANVAKYTVLTRLATQSEVNEAVAQWLSRIGLHRQQLIRLKQKKLYSTGFNAISKTATRSLKTSSVSVKKDSHLASSSLAV